MALDLKLVDTCLTELDRELFRLADGADCERFHKNTQLTAFLLLMFRSSSLIRGLVVLWANGNLEDSFQVLLRGFEEAWYLAHEFRLNGHGEKAARWLYSENDSWKAQFKELVDYAKSRGHAGPKFGKDYGTLSELGHPTQSAAFNSATTVAERQKIDGAREAMAEERENEKKRVSYALYRVLWLLLDQGKGLIALKIDENNLQASSKFVEEYPGIDPNTT
jgi:hypothetical protein